MPCWNEIMDDRRQTGGFIDEQWVKNYDTPATFNQTLKSNSLVVVGPVANTKILTSSLAIANIESLFSDIRFDLSLETDNQVIPLAGTHTSGDSILGAVSNSAITTSVIAPTFSLPYLYTTLLRLSGEKRPCVFHSPAFELSDSLSMIPNPLHNLSIIKDSGCCIIFSSCPQEAYEMSILAHAISKILSVPVVHSYNGVAAAQQFSPVQLLAEDAVSSFFHNISEDSTVDNQLWLSFNQLVSREYSSFEYFGSATATSLIIAFNTSTSDMDELKAALASNTSFALLLIRVYRPWSLQSFLSKIPPSIEKLFIHRSSNLFNDVAGTVYQSTRAKKPLPYLFNSITELPSFRISTNRTFAIDILNFPTDDIIAFTERNLPQEFSLLQSKNSYRVHDTTKWTILNRDRTTVPQQVQAISCSAESLRTPDVLQSLQPGGILIILQNSTTGVQDISEETKEALLEKQPNLILVNTQTALESILLDLLLHRAEPKISVTPDSLSTWIDKLESNETREYPNEKFTLFQGNQSLVLGTARDVPLDFMKTGRTALSLRFMFPESYAMEERLKPESKGIFQVELTNWVRLTPDTYDRNVFHMELDISRTSLTYEIGDALGVYGHNSEDDVNDFLLKRNMDPEELIVYNNYDTKQTNMRTLQQLLIQDIDLFGRPSKRFYSNLSNFATDTDQANKLQDLGDSAGAEEFRARAAESMTMAEIIEEFSSVKLSAKELVELVGPIKPRHYSIASSMNAHPDSVHLLVVDHTWVTPKGKFRRGQCTRYLQGLKVGAKLSVSVKPSVMKLPVDHKTPIVMSGLGTGMAPFRAFIQERVYQAQLGAEIGEMVLYFGSRSSKQEYLYGDELEAYLASGLLTHMGLAFSRDQPQKVYIQHKISEDSSLLWNLLHQQRGHFYLCGPTWPAGDVQTAIATIFSNEGKMEPSKAESQIQMMKNQERYVLEVY